MFLRRVIQEPAGAEHCLAGGSRLRPGGEVGVSPSRRQLPTWWGRIQNTAQGLKRNSSSLSLEERKRVGHVGNDGLQFLWQAGGLDAADGWSDTLNVSTHTPGVWMGQNCGCCGLVAQSCLTRCSSMDHSPPGSSVHGILQARTLEWVAISFSRGSYLPRDRTHVSCPGRRILYHLNHQERWGLDGAEESWAVSLFYLPPWPQISIR